MAGLADGWSALLNQQGTCRFAVAQVVRRRSAPDQTGVVREVKWNDQLEECTYRVQFGGQLKGVPESDLELLPEILDPWEDLRVGRVEGAGAFQRLLTFER